MFFLTIPPPPPPFFFFFLPVIAFLKNAMLTYCLISLLDVSTAEEWPPQDPYYSSAHTEPAHDFSQDTSPWTYGNGVNPNLEPSNTHRRGHAHSNVPPYHPAYNQEGATQRHFSQSSRSSSGSFDEHRIIRRGSEGWEVKQIDREEVLRRYIESRGEEVGRYNYYIPEQAVESESEDEDDDIPLANYQQKGSTVTDTT